MGFKDLISVFLVFLFFTPSWALDKKALKEAGVQELSEEAPDFTLVDKEGQGISLKGLKGRAVLIHVWATWCKPCKEEFPLLDRLYKEFNDKGLVLVPVAIDPKISQGEIDSFARSLGGSFPVYLANRGSITDKYWTWGVPVTYFIDKNGRIAGRAIGPRDWGSKEIKEIIMALIEEPS